MIESIVDIFKLELLLQLGLATLLGGAIGLERELGGKPAGLRTNILICIGSALYTQLSLAMVPAGSDASRVAGQIVTGVGFIGAGTILHARGAVVGLTSAATIWVVAAIGVALGAGHYAEALLATLVVLVVLQGLGRIEIVVERHSTKSHLTVHARGAVVGLTSAATIWVVAAIGVALGAGHYPEALLSTLMVLVVLQGLGRIEIVVERHSTKSHLTVDARPDGAPLEELETVIRRTGLTIVRHESRRENVDLVIDFDLSGPKRLHDQVMIALLHHPAVRTVSTGE